MTSPDRGIAELPREISLQIGYKTFYEFFKNVGDTKFIDVVAEMQRRYKDVPRSALNTLVHGLPSFFQPDSYNPRGTERLKAWRTTLTASPTSEEQNRVRIADREVIKAAIDAMMVILDYKEKREWMETLEQWCDKQEVPQVLLELDLNRIGMELAPEINLTEKSLSGELEIVTV